MNSKCTIIISSSYLLRRGKGSNEKLELLGWQGLLEDLQELLRLTAHHNRIAEMLHSLLVHPWKNLNDNGLDVTLGTSAVQQYS